MKSNKSKKDILEILQRELDSCKEDYNIVLKEHGPLDNFTKRFKAELDTMTRLVEEITK